MTTTRMREIEDGVRAVGEWCRNAGRAPMTAWSNDHLTIKGAKWLEDQLYSTMSVDRIRVAVAYAMTIGY